MIMISHRGCIDGPNEKENEPEFIENALDKFHCEIDLWKINNDLFLGHDLPTYPITENWLIKRRKKLLIHCKNPAALLHMNTESEKWGYHYFWHEEDKYTLTSRGLILTYPGYSCPKGGIAMKCEYWPKIKSGWFGICSDFINSFSNYCGKDGEF